MIWKVKAVEARPTEDENEYEFDAPSEFGGIQVLDFTPEMEFMNEKIPPTVVYAFRDRIQD